MPGAERSALGRHLNGLVDGLSGARIYRRGVEALEVIDADLNPLFERGLASRFAGVVVFHRARVCLQSNRPPPQLKRTQKRILNRDTKSETRADNFPSQKRGNSEEENEA
jgi:hypothetical protein